MARERLISLWRRCSQSTTGSSTAARKRAMTNQPTKCAPARAEERATNYCCGQEGMTTVLITCEGEIRTHTTASLGTVVLGSAGGAL